MRVIVGAMENEEEVVFEGVVVDGKQTGQEGEDVKVEKLVVKIGDKVSYIDPWEAKRALEALFPEADLEDVAYTA